MGWQPAREDWDDNDEVYMQRGSREELDRLMRLALLTEPMASFDDGVSAKQQVCIAAGLRRKARFISDRNLYASDRVARLVTLFLKEHQPVGYSIGYDDESKYWKADLLLWYPLAEYRMASARERMRSRRELACWLAARGHNPLEFSLPAISSTPGLDLPLFSGTQPISKEEEDRDRVVSLNAYGRWVVVPFEIVNRYGLARQFESDRVRMSFTAAYVERAHAAYVALESAHAADGKQIVIVQQRGTPDFTALGPYRAALASRPLRHGDVVRLDKANDHRIAQLVAGPMGLQLAGYRRSRTFLRHIAERVEGDQIPARMRERAMLPPSKDETLYLVRCAGGDGQPSPALECYLRNHQAVAIDVSTLESCASGNGQKLDWAYQFAASKATMKRFQSACSDSYQRRTRVYRAAKLPGVRYWRCSPIPES